MGAKIVFTSIELKEKLKGIYQSLRNILSNQPFLYKHFSYLYPPVSGKSLQITNNSCLDPLRNCFSRIFTKTSATKRRKVDVKRFSQAHRFETTHLVADLPADSDLYGGFPIASRLSTPYGTYNGLFASITGNMLQVNRTSTNYQAFNLNTKGR